MKKKKAKSRTAVTKTAKKKGKSKKQKETHPAEVRKDISLMVESEAAEMAQAVIDEGKKGQLAPVKYLLELAKIFPASTDGSESTAHEDSLAQTLLTRLNLPIEPIGRDDEDELVMIKPMVKVSPGKDGEEREAKQHLTPEGSGQGETHGEEQSDSVSV